MVNKLFDSNFIFSKILNFGKAFNKYLIFKSLVQTAFGQCFVNIVRSFILFGVVPRFGNGFLNGVDVGFGSIKAHVQHFGFGAPFGGRNASN